MTPAQLQKRLAAVEHQLARVGRPDQAEAGRAAFREMGVDLDKLSDDQLMRLEILAKEWPPDSDDIPACAIRAAIGAC